MPSPRALILTAAALLAPPSLHARAALGRDGGAIGVIGPASALTQPVGRSIGAPGTALPRVQNDRHSMQAQPRGAGNSCTIYGFIGGLSGGGTLSSIGVFDLTGQTQGGFALGTRAAVASGTAGSLQADIGAAPQGSIAGQVVRQQMGNLLTVATTTGCNSGTTFTTALTSNPAGSGNTVVAVLNTQRIEATYTVAYNYDPNNPYYCYYNNNPFNYFPCNIFYAQANFSFLTSTFPAQGAGNYSLTIVQATVNVQ